MKNRNKESTRYYSEMMESSVAEALGGRRTANSGATKFSKGDVALPRGIIECKTSMAEKDSFSIKKEWLDKTREEAFQQRKEYSALAIRFSPDGENYYVISEILMKQLITLLEG